MPRICDLLASVASPLNGFATHSSVGVVHPANWREGGACGKNYRADKGLLLAKLPANGRAIGEKLPRQANALQSPAEP
jgi:hypothetical protein